MDLQQLNNGIYNVLRHADVDDIDVLVDYLTDKGEGRLMLESHLCRTLIAAKKAREYSNTLRERIADEIKAFGSHTLKNLFRKDAIDYSSVVQDVANHLKAPFNKSTTDANVEAAIIQKLFADSVLKMSEAERTKVFEDLGIGDHSVIEPAAVAVAIAAGRMTGLNPYRYALIVANAVAKAILGRGLTWTGNIILTRTVSIMLGPIGWVLTGLWTAFDLGSPAYRVTVPCIVQIAYMRLKAIDALTTTICTACEARNSKENKFCSDCGSTLSIILPNLTDDTHSATSHGVTAPNTVPSDSADKASTGTGVDQVRKWFKEGAS